MQDHGPIQFQVTMQKNRQFSKQGHNHYNAGKHPASRSHLLVIWHICRNRLLHCPGRLVQQRQRGTVGSVTSSKSCHVSLQHSLGGAHLSLSLSHVLYAMAMSMSITTARRPGAVSTSRSSAHCIGGRLKDTGYKAEVSTKGSDLGGSVPDVAARSKTEMGSGWAGTARARESVRHIRSLAGRAATASGYPGRREGRPRPRVTLAGSKGGHSLRLPWQAGRAATASGCPGRLLQ